MINIDEKIDYNAAYNKILKNKRYTNNKILANCPFHKNGQEKHPSFCVDIETGQYNCFTCGEKGNYLTFMAKLNGTDTKAEYNTIVKDVAPIQNKYTLEQYAEEKKLSVQWLKDEWNITNSGNKIEIPYLDESSSVIATRTRGLNKDFKWKRNSKLSLYGLNKIEEIIKQGYVVLVEGESDTHTLWSYSIPTLGVPGASTFKAEWVEYLKGLQIYIHNEGDQGGHIFARNIKETLTIANFKDDIYEISCKEENAKDPSELHCKYSTHFVSKWTNIINRGLKVDLMICYVPELFKGCPIKLTLPSRWRIDETGIYYVDPKTEITTKVINMPIIPYSRALNLDNGTEKLELAYLIDGHWEYQVFQRTVLFQTKSAPILNEIGIPVTSENAKFFVKYLNDMESENKYHLPKKYLVTQLGWHKNKFIPFDKEVIVDTDKTLAPYLYAYRKEGTLNNWIENINPFRNNYIFRFILASSFAAPLLKLIHHRIFFVHNWADSRSGKTAALKAALSVWGNPEELMTTFSSTKVGLEKMAGFFNDLPLGIDERQVSVNKQEDIESLVYMLSTGMSKLRGSKNGGLQDCNRWNSIVLTTGEEPLSNTSTYTGVSSRVIELYGSPFVNETNAGSMHSLVLDNYGLAGEEFMNHLIQEYSKDKYSKLKEQFKEIEDKLSINNFSKAGSHRSAIALVTLADILISKWLFKEDETESLKMGANILENISSAQDIDVVKKAYDYTVGWIKANYGNFDSYSERFGATPNNGNSVRYGLVDYNTYYVFPHILENELQSKGFSYRKILSGFAERGYIKGSKDKNSVQIRYKGSNTRFIQFVLEDEAGTFD